MYEYDLETLDQEQLGDPEVSDYEALAGDMEGEGGWDQEGILEESVAGDLESYVLGETGYGDPEDWEGYGDQEADEFLGRLLRTGVQTVRKVAQQSGIGTPMLKTVAQQAAKCAAGAIAGQPGVKAVRQVVSQALKESEYGDYESDVSFESLEALGVDPEILDEMHYNAAMAAEAESDEEADEFIGAIANLAGQVLPGLVGGLFGGGEGEGEFSDQERDEFLPALLPLAAPLIGQGVQAIGNLLRRGGRRTRPAVRALPAVAANTAAELARRARTRRPINRQVVAQTMARQTARTMGNRRALAGAIRQNRGAAGRAQARPWGRRRRPGAGGYAGIQPGPGGPGPRKRGRLVGYVPVYAFRGSLTI